MASVGKAGIDLDEIRARAQTRQGVLGAVDAADADDGKGGSEFRAQLPDDRDGPGMDGCAAQTTAMLFGPCSPEHAEVGRRVRCDDAFHAKGAQRGRYRRDLLLIQVRGYLDEQRNALRMTGLE